jgi:uncharacterized protein YydD (DUF2326 family)
MTLRLSRMYSNKPDVFAPISFNHGLSVVLAEIRVPANRDLDTHNLGKTTVGELLDYCLLKGKNSSFFLFKHESRFAEFTFYLELVLADGSYLTIARPVDPGTRIDLLRSSDPIQEITDVPVEEWDHTNLAFERARTIVDGALGFEALKPWSYRKLVGYLIRSQSDYLDVFQLGKFSGKHQDWKPFVAHLLGLEAETVINLYDKREELSEATSHLGSLVREWGGEEVDASVLDGLISVKRRDIETRAKVLDSFNFGSEDQRVTAEVVETIEATISARNEESYHLVQLIQRLETSLEDEKIIFRTDDAEKLFREAGVAFAGELKRDYAQLVAFNRAITKERREALEAQLAETRVRANEVAQELRELNVQRAQALEFLRESESLVKYKKISRELADMQADLSLLEARREAASRLIELRREQRALSEEFGHLQTAVEREIADVSKDEDSHFGRLRRYFTDIVFDVLGQNAILAIRMNAAGGIDFTAEFVGESGTATSGDKGTSYKKLLCIAFDLAMLRAHAGGPFPRFVYHDGALEQLEPRKRQNLIEVFRQYAAHGIQPVISALDSDLPAPVGSTPAAVAEGEIILTLHDEGDDGRLFKMAAW